MFSHLPQNLHTFENIGALSNRIYYLFTDYIYSILRNVVYSGRYPDTRRYDSDVSGEGD